MQNIRPEEDSYDFTPLMPEEASSSMGWQVTLQQLSRWRMATLITGSATLVLALCIAIMLPLKTTETRYVEFKGEKEHFFKVYPADLPKDQKELLVRKALRQYVTDRQIVEQETLKERAKRLRAMSTEQSFEYAKKHALKSAKYLRGGRREVQIVTDFPISEGAHQVEFMARDFNEEGTMVAEKSWIAHITYEISEKAIRADEELSNPLGLVVNRYTLTAKPDGSQPDAASANAVAKTNKEAFADESIGEEEKPKKRRRASRKKSAETDEVVEQ